LKALYFAIFFLLYHFCCPGVTKPVQLQFAAVSVNTFIRFAVVLTLLFVCTLIVSRVADWTYYCCV